MPSNLDIFALAVTHFEGIPGDRNYRNRNPGNLKFMHQHEATGQDPEGFAIFPTWDAGFRALKAQIALDARRTPGLTISEFVEKYAPPNDNNPNNSHYAASIASALRVTVHTPLGALALV